MAKEQKRDLRCYGLGKVTENGQITVPSEARDEMGIEPKDKVLVFGDLERSQLIVVPNPPPSELLEFASRPAPQQPKRPGLKS